MSNLNPLRTERSSVSKDTTGNVAPNPQSSDSYLSELLSYSLDRLRKEPELLKQESSHLERQISETSVTHYESFLSAEQCLQAVHNSFDKLDQTLNGINIHLSTP